MTITERSDPTLDENPSLPKSLLASIRATAQAVAERRGRQPLAYFDQEDYEFCHPRLVGKLRAAAGRLRKVRAKELRRASSIARRNVRYLWDPYLPSEGLVVIAGDSDSGKTWLFTQLATAITTGSKLRDRGRRKGEFPPAEVILLQRENDEGAVIVPRLEGLGADTNRVVVPDEAFSFRPDHDLSGYMRLAWYIQASGARAVFIDPITSYMGGRMNDQGDVRVILERLKVVGQYTGAVIVFVAHLNKDTEKPVKFRISGSQEFYNVPDSVLVASADPNGRSEPDAVDLLVHHDKNRLGQRGHVVAYSILGKNQSLRWEWRKADLNSTADSIAQTKYALDDAHAFTPTHVERCRRVVVAICLAADEPVPADRMKTLVQESVDFKITKATWQRVAKDWALSTVEARPGIYVWPPLRRLDQDGNPITEASDHAF